MEEEKPVGGIWNFDTKNRRPYDVRVPIPEALI
jgi:deoxyribodipyrimidine photolyase-like uncharacterized protein